MARKYTKRNKEYWQSLTGKSKFQNQDEVESLTKSFLPESTGGSWEESKAFYSTPRRLREKGHSSGSVSCRFPNIDAGILPYEYDSGAVTIEEAVELVMKAWSSVQIFRNTIESMAELSATKYHLKGKNKSALIFFEKWLKRIDVQSLAEQFFRERYRSGNIPVYRVDGKLTPNAKKKLEEVFAASLASGEIPLKYIILNPARLAIDGDSGQYFQVFRSIDIQKFDITKDEWDEMIKTNLKKDFGIKSGNQSVLIPLKPEKLSVFFYQKQDYEPLAIPPFWGILDDLELKMELKKIDRHIIRTVENVILKVTQGDEKIGINHAALNALKNLFSNPSVQRVLVADYTTKAEFIIPDVKRVLGKEKYEVVDRDIRDGLQSVLLGDEKFSNLSAKIELFLERINKGREEFVDFIRREMGQIARNLNFNEVPDFEFEEITLKDKAQLQRVVTRLYELGILSAKDTIHALDTGLYPNFEDNIKNQKEQIKLRQEDNIFMPAQNQIDNGADGKPQGQTGPQDNPKPAQANELIAAKNCVKSAQEITQFKTVVANFIKSKKQKKRLNKDESQYVEMLSKAIVGSNNKEDWEESLESCYKNGGDVPENLEVVDAIIALASKHNITDEQAAIIYHSYAEKV